MLVPASFGGQGHVALCPWKAWPSCSFSAGVASGLQVATAPNFLAHRPLALAVQRNADNAPRRGMAQFVSLPISTFRSLPPSHLFITHVRCVYRTPAPAAARDVSLISRCLSFSCPPVERGWSAAGAPSLACCRYLKGIARRPLHGLQPPPQWLRTFRPPLHIHAGRKSASGARLGVRDPRWLFSE